MNNSERYKYMTDILVDLGYYYNCGSEKGVKSLLEKIGDFSRDYRNNENYGKPKNHAYRHLVNCSSYNVVAVLAGNYEEYAEYRDKNSCKNSRHSVTKFVYCGNRFSILGYEFSSMIEIGTFASRKDADEIRKQVLVRVRS